jgi:CBS domain containing-hemolysin-like protein
MGAGPIGQLCAITIGGVNIWLFVASIILIVCSSYFSASETAFSTVNQIRLKSLADNNVRGARKAIYITEHYEKTLSTILIGNNIVNIGVTTICAYIFSTLIANPALANVLNTLIMTIIILIFGEILPKTITKVEPQKFALRTSGIMYFLMKLFTPISFFFLKMQNMATRKIKKANEVAEEPTVTEGELESIIDTMEEEGVISPENAEVMQGVLELSNRTAYDIMTPRVDVSAVNYTESVKNVQDMFMKTMYSRLPVYDETIDKVIGILNQKDFFKALLSGEKVMIKKIMTEPLFINDNMKVDDIIRRMQSSKKHMAIVLDEYGGTSGIVCMEDAIEEVVGEIYDEHDEEVKVEVVEKNNNEYIVDSEMDLKDLFEMLEIEHLPESEYSSVGGFLFGLTEDLPEEGKEITYKTVDERVVDGVYVSVLVELHFVLTKVEDNRIKEILVKVIDVNGENEKEEVLDESDFDESKVVESDKTEEGQDEEKSSKLKSKK